MKPEKFREFTEDELFSKIDDLEEELFNLRMTKGIRELDNPMRVGRVKKDIARAKTILNEYRLEALHEESKDE